MKPIPMRYKLLFIYIASFSVLLIVGVLFFQQKKVNPIDVVMKNSRIQNDAKLLALAGRYIEALDMYEVALQPQFIVDPYQKAAIYGAVQEIYKWLWRLDDAQKINKWFFDNQTLPEPTVRALEERGEISALILYAQTGDDTQVREHISLLRRNNGLRLKDENYAIGSEVIISDILRLYNMIGRHQDGIDFIDELLSWGFRTRTDLAVYKDSVKSSQQAQECIEAGQGGDGIKIDWRACKWIREYLLVREGFEQDKAEGFKGCAGKKPGEECVGHAMKALIKSDYFPW